MVKKLIQVDTGEQYGCILSLYIFNLYVEYLLREARLEDDEHDFKTEGRNSNLCYPDDSILIAENAKDLQSLVIKVKKHSEKK